MENNSRSVEGLQCLKMLQKGLKKQKKTSSAVKEWKTRAAVMRIMKGRGEQRGRLCNRWRESGWDGVQGPGVISSSIREQLTKVTWAHKTHAHSLWLHPYNLVVFFVFFLYLSSSFLSWSFFVCPPKKKSLSVNPLHNKWIWTSVIC